TGFALIPVDIFVFRWSGSMPEWTVGAKVHEGTGHRIHSEFPAGWISQVFGHRARDQRFGSPAPPAGKFFDEARNRLHGRRLLFYSLFRDRLRSLFRASSLFRGPGQAPGSGPGGQNQMPRLNPLLNSGSRISLAST